MPTSSGAPGVHAQLDTTCWLSIRDRLPRPLTDAEVEHDMRHMVVMHRCEGAMLPGRRELAKRWGWSEYRVRPMLTHNTRPAWSLGERVPSEFWRRVAFLAPRTTKVSQSQQKPASTTGWFTMEAGWWPAVAQILPLPWPRAAAIMDMRYHANLVRIGKRDKVPPRADLLSRWGWTKHHAQGLLSESSNWACPIHGVPPGALNEPPAFARGQST